MSVVVLDFPPVWSRTLAVREPFPSGTDLHSGTGTLRTAPLRSWYQRGSSIAQVSGARTGDKRNALSQLEPRIRPVSLEPSGQSQGTLRRTYTRRMAGRFKTDVLDRALARQRREREALRLAVQARALQLLDESPVALDEAILSNIA